MHRHCCRWHSDARSQGANSHYIDKFGPSVPFKMWHQRKHQSSASLAFVRRIHRRPVNSPHKGPVTRKMFPFDDVIMGTNFPQSLVFLLTWTSVAVLLVSYCGIQLAITLQRRHNECDGVSNQQLHDRLFNRLFRCRSKKISKLRGTGLCEFKNLLNTWWYWFHNAITEYICSIWTGAFKKRIYPHTLIYIYIYIYIYIIWVDIWIALCLSLTHFATRINYALS